MLKIRITEPGCWDVGKSPRPFNKFFSEFGLYSSRKQKSTLNAIANQIKDGEMPLWSYTLMHRNAKLSEKDKAILLLWLDKMIGE